MKKVTAMMVAIIFLLALSGQSYAGGNEERINSETIQIFDKINELTTEYADAYLTGEDQVTYIIDTEKIHYQDSNGDWQDVDNEIIEGKDEKGNVYYTNKANNFITNFSINEKGQPVTEIIKGEYSIDFILLSDFSKLGLNNELINYEYNDYLNTVNNQNNSLIYKNIFSNSDVAYTVYGNQLKEDIVFYSEPATLNISYAFKCNNLEFKRVLREYIGCNEDTGEKTAYSKSVGVFYDPKTDEEIFELYDFFMVDTNNHTSGDLKWEYEETGEGYEFKLILDEEFLKREDLKYPIIVDPTVTVSGSSNTFDTYASRLYPDNNYYLNSYLRTGNDTSYGIRRTFINWSLPNIGYQYPITGAEIQLRKYSSSGSINLLTGRLTTAWTSSSLTWWNSPNYDSNSEVDNGYLSSDWYYIDVTEIGKRWYSGQYPDNGVKIYDEDESSTSVWATFCASDYSTTSYNPKLVITYYTGNTLWVRYNGGYSSSTIYFKNECTTYYDQVFSATRAWREAGWNLWVDSSSLNRVFEYTIDDGVYGWYSPPAVDGHIEIKINITRIAAKKEWDGYAQSTLVHEMGHALWLENIDFETRCIMGTNRDRNTLIYPTASDIAGVDAKW